MAEAQVIRLHSQRRASPGTDTQAAQSVQQPAAGQAGWEQRAAAGLAFLRRRITGDYPVDDFGFDPDLPEATVLLAARQLYRRWFRTEVTGAHHLPPDSGALIVANHAGALWALDGVMTATAVHDETPNHRGLRRHSG